MPAADDQPVIFPGQMAVVVTEDGETVLRETLIPPPAKKPTADWMTLDLSEEDS